jgi:hypothetical protein
MASVTHSGRPALLVTEQHEEWLLDDAIDDTFPASDPVSHGQPGSIVNMRYAAREARASRTSPARLSSTARWVLLGAAVACALLLARRSRRLRRTTH